MRTETDMRLTQAFLEQEEILEKQAALIRGLLTEILQFRALSKEEQRLLDNKEANQWKQVCLSR